MPIISGDVHIECGVSLAIFHQRAKRNHMCSCQQPIMPAKEERNVSRFGLFKWRKSGSKRQKDAYLEKNNQKLRETSSKHGFLHLFCLKMCHFWDATKSRPWETFFIAAAQVSQHFALKSLQTQHSNNPWNCPTQTTKQRVSVPILVIQSECLKAERYDFFHHDIRIIFTLRFSKSLHPTWGTSSTSSCDLTSMNLPSCSWWIVASPARVLGLISAIKTHLGNLL